MPDEQYCGKCKKTKPLDADHFYRDASNKTGFARNWCKPCTKKYNNARRKKRAEKAGMTIIEVLEINEEPSEKQRAFGDVCFTEQMQRRTTGVVSRFRPIDVAVPVTDEQKKRTIKVFSGLAERM